MFFKSHMYLLFRLHYQLCSFQTLADAGKIKSNMNKEKDQLCPLIVTIPKGVIITISDCYRGWIYYLLSFFSQYYNFILTILERLKKLIITNFIFFSAILKSDYKLHFYIIRNSYYPSEIAHQNLSYWSKVLDFFRKFINEL